MLYKCVMRPFPAALVIAGALLASIGCAGAAVVINVDKRSQRMSVEVDGEPRYEFAVSTGRAGYGTPNGTYHPQRLEREWFSKEYYDSPMPYSIFFNRGYAIHGSYEIRHLGGPASHGCIRLHPSNAAKLFALVQKEGAGNTKIVVSGANPPGRSAARRDALLNRDPHYEPGPRKNLAPGSAAHRCALPRVRGTPAHVEYCA